MKSYAISGDGTGKTFAVYVLEGDNFEWLYAKQIKGGFVSIEEAQNYIKELQKAIDKL